MKEKKVGIMTWYTYRNYGTALQVSALSHVISELGYDNEVISYLPRGRVKIPQKITFKLLTKKVAIKLLKRGRNRYTSDEQENLYVTYYRNRIRESKICRTYPELYDLNSEYDVFVCGSDQIWSPLCFDEAYFLSFVEDCNKMIAYAPSIGSFEVKNPKIKERMAKIIKRFSHLSIREQQGAEIIKSLTEKNAKVVLDPTLLLNTEEWIEYADINNCKQIKKDYMICYFLGDSHKYMNYVCKLSEQLNLPFYVIPVTSGQKNSKNVVPFEVGPSEFVSLIKNASFVCTDSFHGMAFSINFNIPFIVFKRFKDNDLANQNSRIFNLLNLVSLESRLVDYNHAKNMQNLKFCDFTEANKSIKKLRKDSIGYLSDSLKEAVFSKKESTEKFKITDMCCGCGACATVCGQNAIVIQKDKEGFYHYNIDENKCIECKICQTVCPMIHIQAKEISEAKALYSMKSNSEVVLKQSSSGGIGYELGKYLLEKGYHVCGCMYDSDSNSAKHILINSEVEEQLSLLQGSKYIQSYTADAMKQIKNIAKSKKIVFFGTPCQAAAVDKLLRKYGVREEALIVDLICHGVPTAYLWDKYLHDIDMKYKTGTHPKVLFRSQEVEWRRRLLLVEGNGHIYKQEEIKDDFYAFFRRSLCYMESCSECPYREKSASDIRIGDYWGNKFIKDKQGVSMVIANTENGQNTLRHLVDMGLCSQQEQSLNEYWTVQFPYNYLKPFFREELIADLKDENTSMCNLRKEYCGQFDKREQYVKYMNFVKKLLNRV